MTRLTHDEFLCRLKEKNRHFDDICFLSMYIKNNEKLHCRCKICGTEWFPIANNLLNGKGCPNCGRISTNSKNMKTHEQFVCDMKIKNPDIKIIGEYINHHTPLLCECLICGYQWMSKPKYLHKKQGCIMCLNRDKAKSHDIFLAELEMVNSNIQILSEYRNAKTRIKCRCLDCLYEWDTYPDSLLNGSGCPCCCNRVCVTGINDVATTHPELVKYFVTPDEAKGVTYGVNKLFYFKCPDCGHIKLLTINYLSNFGFHCDICSDFISYPNKLLRAFLFLLPVNNVDFEYSPDWAKGRRYDGYFEYNEQRYVVEMDGEWHIKDNNLSGKTAEQSQIDDAFKDKMAQENNHIMIRIPCYKSEIDYISKNINQSIFGDIFDLSMINWEECDKVARQNIIKNICEYYFNGGTLDEIANVFLLHKNTIKRYIEKGKNIGWC